MPADMAGGIVAGLMACPLYGDHAPVWDKMMPWGDHHMERESMSRMLDAAENGEQTPRPPQGNIMSADHLTTVVATDPASTFDPERPTKIKTFALSRG